MSKQYRNTPQKTTDMKFEPLDHNDAIVSQPHSGVAAKAASTGIIHDIVSDLKTADGIKSETAIGTVTIPDEGDSRIRKIEFADGRQEFHIEVFRGENWIQLSKKENFKGAQEQVDKIRNNRIVVNEILTY